MSIQSADEFLKLDPSVQRTEIETMIAEINRFRRQKYGLKWNENLIADEHVVTQCRDKFPVLDVPDDTEELPTFLNAQPTKKDLFDNADAPQPTHLLIEGDNYHALSALQFTHKGKVDLIYIDPPYNTGNRDFRYNDNFIDKENNDRHSLWLSFMKRRLDLAKELLKDSGVIFISIDDNEVAQLKLLCDAVFGEDNFVAIIAVVNNFKGRSDAKFIATAHENLLIYKRPNFITNGVPVPEEYIDEYKLEEKNGEKYRLQGLRKRGSGALREDRPNMYYPFYFNIESKELSLKKTSNNDVEILPKLSSGVDGRWRWGKETAADRLEELTVQSVKRGKDEYDVFQKDYLQRGDDMKRVKPKSLWLGSEFSSDAGTKSLKDVIHNPNFNNPKSIDLIKYCLEQATPTDTPSVILDFFAGSGTTLHTVLEMNRQDGGRRQCILVTNNEVTDKTRRELENKGMTEAEIDAQGICRAVTYPRVRRVIEGYTNAKGDKVAGTGGKLRYYRLAYVERGDRHPDSLKLRIREKCTEMLCIKENVFHLVADSDAVQFNGKGWEIYQDYAERGTQLVILSEDTPQYSAALLEKVRDLKADRRILYVFSYQKKVNDADFEDFKALGFDLQTMPSGIVELYNQLYQNIVVKDVITDSKDEEMPDLFTDYAG